MASVQDVLAMLRERAQPGAVEGMARFGMTPDARLGVSVPDMRRIAKSVGRDHDLALALWETGIPEARILASMVDNPAQLTEAQMERWVADFNSWDVCDQVCMNLFDRSPLAWRKVSEWAQREEEFVRRAAYSLIACLAWHDKAAPDEAFTAFFPIIKAGAADGRNYVKKAVSWALRQVGKRNANLRRAALEVAREIGQMDSKPARWIASDVIRELEKA
ncbi:MAG: DNA alkylation repair protein [Anaerolineae bacterium]|nr:DNA alkylation repair protein [Anaerolineae bacterium]